MVSTLAHDDGNIQVAVATVTPSQAVRVTPGRRVTVHSGSDSEVGHWQPRVGPQTDASDRDRHWPKEKLLKRLELNYLYKLSTIKC